MAVRKKGRSTIEVEGRRFVWYVHRETHVRIASEDKRFIVAYRWFSDPELSVSGQEFPRVSPSEPRPVVIRPPDFTYRSPAELARQVIKWALFSDVRVAGHSDA